MKRFAIRLVALVLALLLCACGRADQEFVLPEAGEAGGYHLSANSIEITVYVTGQQKFVELATPDGARLQCYADQTEMLLIDIRGSETTYHKEPVTDPQAYQNPLTHIFASLQPLTFTLTDPKASLFRADVTEETEVSKTVTYTEYFLTTEWLDGKTYHFQYFIDDYGATLVSVEAPDEINSAFTENSPWQIDVENRVIRNTQTGALVDLAITKTATHEGPPLTTGETEVRIHEYSVEVALNADGTAKTVRFLYPNAELHLQILNEFQFPAVALPQNARKMSPEEAQDALFRILAAEMII